LVARTTMKGKREVQTYFHNYSGKSDWLLVPGFVEGRPAVLVCDPGQPSAAPLYFVLLGWKAGALAYVRDFRYARYAIEAAEMQRLGPALAAPRPGGRPPQQSAGDGVTAFPDRRAPIEPRLYASPRRRPSLAAPKHVDCNERLALPSPILVLSAAAAAAAA